MHKKIFLVLILLLIFPKVLADNKITTIAQIDIYGKAKIEHTFNEPLEEVNLNVYLPESIDAGNIKFSITGNTLTLKTVEKANQIRYLSDSLAKKDGDWTIKYNSLNPETFKLILPFSANIKKITGTYVQSKDRIGQIIEWDNADNIAATYTINTSEETSIYQYLFYTLSVLFIAVLLYRIKQPSPKEFTAFIERMKGIKRTIIRQTIYAILVLAYYKQDKLIDQSKIRWTLSECGFKNIKSHKGEIHNILSEELNWLIDKNASKITIKESAEKDYALKENARKIIKTMKKSKLIGDLTDEK